MRRRRSSGDLPISGSFSETDILPPITEQHDESTIEEPDSSQQKQFSLGSETSGDESTNPLPPGPLPPDPVGKLKKSDSKKSFSGMISKIMKQNRTAKLWKEETNETRNNFRPKPKFFKSRSLSFEGKSTSYHRALSDQGYESSEQGCDRCQRDSGEEDDAECAGCRPKPTYIYRSRSLPGIPSQDSMRSREKMASRHWQWYLRSSTNTWQSFNTDKTYCY